MEIYSKIYRANQKVKEQLLVYPKLKDVSTFFAPTKEKSFLFEDASNLTLRYLTKFKHGFFRDGDSLKIYLDQTPIIGLTFLRCHRSKINLISQRTPFTLWLESSSSIYIEGEFNFSLFLHACDDIYINGNRLNIHPFLDVWLSMKS